MLRVGRCEPAAVGHRGSGIAAERRQEPDRFRAAENFCRHPAARAARAVCRMRARRQLTAAGALRPRRPRILAHRGKRTAMKLGVLQFFSWPERRVDLATVYARALERIEIMDRT